MAKIYYILAFALVITSFLNSSAKSQDTSWYQPIQEYKDSIVFTVPQYGDFTIGGGRKFHPQRFRMRLPAKPEHQYSYSYKFTRFHFKDGQYMIVYMNPRASANEKQADSTWTVDKPAVAKYLGLMATGEKTDSYLPMPGRKSEAHRKGGNEVILVNVKPENYQQFLEAAKTLRIL